MNLLITGGAGFIGSNLIRQIIDRTQVCRLVNVDCLTYAGHLVSLKGLGTHPKYVFAKVDLRNRKGILDVIRQYEISHVIHLAAESHVDHSICDPAVCVDTNIVGTFNLLDSCRSFWDHSFEKRRFLHVSTDEVYGSLVSTGYFTEATPYAPNSPYSASKAASDFLVRAYYQTYGLPVVTTNCSNNYGPYQHPEKLIPLIIQNIIERKPLPVYGDGLNVRDWLYVSDHAEALWEVLINGRLGEKYNIGGYNERTNISMVEGICDVMDETAPELGGNSRRLISFVPDRPGHDRRYAIDCKKIYQELGWAAAHALEAGIRQTVKWYLENQTWVRKVRI